MRIGCLTYTATTVLAVLLLILCSCTEKASIVGKWIDDKTEAIIEYTADGYYYEYANENFTTDKTKYKISGDKITYYLDGGSANEGFSVEYDFNEEGNLVIAGEIEYRPMRIPNKDEVK